MLSGSLHSASYKKGSAADSDEGEEVERFHTHCEEVSVAILFTGNSTPSSGCIRRTESLKFLGGGYLIRAWNVVVTVGNPKK